MKKSKIWVNSAIFIILMGIVSMFSDMTHEGAKSIYGSFLDLTGAKAHTISLISGLGEFAGCSLIIVTGLIANKTKKYWTMIFIGYALNLLAIPMLALTGSNGWIFAFGIILAERIGKAIRKPAKSTLISFSSKNLGEGKSFAFVEFLDQIGAFIGPLILTLVIYLKGTTNLLNTYKTGFLVLGIPAIITLIILIIAHKKYPNPEELEEDEHTNIEDSKFKFEKKFVYYLIAICLCAFSFIDFPLITYHIQNLNLFEVINLPLLYSLAMLVDAFAALLFGFLFDKFGIKVLVFSTITSMLFPLFIFYFDSKLAIFLGIIMWGIGMGSQESILKSAVAKLINKQNRSIGFGIFEGLFGIFWFVGSFLLGYVYESSLIIFIVISIVLQIISIPFFMFADIENRAKLK